MKSGHILSKIFNQRVLVARVAAVLMAASLWAAACASDPSDDVVGESAPGTDSSAATATDVDADVTSRAPDDSGASDSGTSDSGTSDSGTSDSGTSDSGTSERASSPDSVSSDGSPQQSAAAPNSNSADEQSSNPTTRDGTNPTAAATQNATASPAGTLIRFSECSALAEYLQEHADAAAWAEWSGVTTGDELSLESAQAEEAVPLRRSAPTAGENYSISNLQEAGVDEPDVIKTDGERLVISLGLTIFLVDVSGSSPTVLDSLLLEGDWANSMLLAGDRLLVFIPGWGMGIPFDDVAPDSGNSLSPSRPRRPLTGSDWGPTLEIVEVDLSGGQLRVAESLRIDGQYVGARMTDGVVRVVTSLPARPFGWDTTRSSDGEGPNDGAASASDTNDTELFDAAAHTWLPRFERVSATRTVTERGTLGSCERTWAPEHFAGSGTLSVTTFDFASDGVGGNAVTTSILADGQNVYASTDHLYVAATRIEAERLWFESQRSLNEDIELPELFTEVHQFDLSDPTEATHVASATVPGLLLNQYSMSAHEGYLRVATTTSPSWFFGDETPSQSLLTVLDARDGQLSTVSQIGGLGVGEQIFAVRYLGDVAVVVTFRQVDPLYLIDLADPTAPQVTGELKITGYSAYLHPLGDGLLLGVGQEADLQGVTRGTQVSLFDIADMSRPERLDQWTLPDARSSVEFDALRFLHWPASEMVVLPVVQHLDDPDSDADSDTAAADVLADPPLLGAVALGTAGRQLTERARLSHADEPTRRCNEHREIVVLPDGTEQSGPLERYCWYEQDWEAQITASAVVGDRLYLASAKGLQTVEVDTLASVDLLRWDD